MYFDISNMYPLHKDVGTKFQECPDRPASDCCISSVVAVARPCLVVGSPHNHGVLLIIIYEVLFMV